MTSSCNLPYVREDEWEGLAPEITHFEPRDALVWAHGLRDPRVVAGATAGKQRRWSTRRTRRGGPGARTRQDPSRPGGRERATSGRCREADEVAPSSAAFGRRRGAVPPHRLRARADPTAEGVEASTAEGTRALGAAALSSSGRAGVAAPPELGEGTGGAGTPSARPVPRCSRSPHASRSPERRLAAPRLSVRPFGRARADAGARWPVQSSANPTGERMLRGWDSSRGSGGATAPRRRILPERRPWWCRWSTTRRRSFEVLREGGSSRALEAVVRAR